MGKSSFVPGVRETTDKRQLQLKILKDLGVRGAAFDNIEQGKNILSTHLTSSEVLIVLDDLDKEEDLDTLLPARDRIKPDSVVIVTTQTDNDDLLKSWGISSTYEMELLDPSHAKQIFCYHAFLQPVPRHDFGDLVTRFVYQCKGLPLHLKVFGRQLRGESRRESWQSLLDMISRSSAENIENASYDDLDNEEGEIEERLIVSYNSLDCEKKEMFLDAACFFLGERKSLAIEVWNGLGLDGSGGLETLLNKCLIELDDIDYIRMNDSLKEMGREIAMRQAPYRFWPSQQTITLENQEEQRISIRGIMAMSTHIQSNYFGSGSGKPFPELVDGTGEDDEIGVRCENGELVVNTNQEIRSLAPSSVGLNFFAIRGHHFSQVMGGVSSELVWLRWMRIGQRNLPRELSLINLSVLELIEKKSQKKPYLEELWCETDGEGNVLQAPDHLRELIISQCLKVQCFPSSIKCLNLLKKIVIIENHRVSCLPEEFCDLQSLEHLVLYRCTELSALPRNFGNLRNLQLLCLSGCHKLTMLPNSLRNLIYLEHLNIKGCYDIDLDSEKSKIPDNVTKLESD